MLRGLPTTGRCPKVEIIINIECHRWGTIASSEIKCYLSALRLINVSTIIGLFIFEIYIQGNMEFLQFAIHYVM